MDDPYAFSIMLALKKSFQDFRELDESKGSRYSEWFVTTRDGHSAITKAIDLNMLESRRNNYLAAVFRSSPKSLGLAFADHTTGEFRAAEFSSHDELLDELSRLQPAELLHSDDQTGDFAALHGATALEPWPFLLDQARHLLLDHFKVQSLDGFGLADLTSATCAAGAILHYLRDVLRRNISHLRRLQRATSDHTVIIDAASRANLDLVSHRNGHEHSLLAALDRTINGILTK